MIQVHGAHYQTNSDYSDHHHCGVYHYHHGNLIPSLVLGNLDDFGYIYASKWSAFSCRV